jgi:ABC-type polysaccharide/polyol phosphate transport system ATPase subunit
MFARLAFSVAIHVDPDVLIVDEILSVGDSAFQRKCVRRFHEVRESGCTILLVAHDDYLVRTLCAKALYLREGRMIAFGMPGEVVDRYVQDTMPPPAAAAVPDVSFIEVAANAPEKACAPEASASEISLIPG